MRRLIREGMPASSVLEPGEAERLLAAQARGGSLRALELLVRREDQAAERERERSASSSAQPLSAIDDLAARRSA